MDTKKYECLRLENQLCFPLYACSKEVVRRYKPFLDELELTYTQYIVMMVMWSEKEITSKELGNKLYLDSGTLTPVLKKLEAKKYIERSRDSKDERNLVLFITEEGEKLKEKAVLVPARMGGCVHLTTEEAQMLYVLLNKVLNGFAEEEMK